MEETISNFVSRKALVGILVAAATTAAAPAASAAGTAPSVGADQVHAMHTGRTGTAQLTKAGTTAAPIYVTLLFSRSEIAAADDCIPNTTNIARLDAEIAPWLASYGITGTGTLQTGSVEETTPHCTHHNSSLVISWAGAKTLSDQGWSFVSHTATYPAHMDRLGPAQSYAETCGSAAAIDAHGLHGGHGLIAYPGVQPQPTALQTNYGAKCFTWGRQYGGNATTTAVAATTAPYWQNTGAPNGGPCNVSTAPCYTVPAKGNRYAPPTRVLKKIANLKAGDWFTLQSYVEVRGASPAYTSSTVKWDCTSADPKLHWSNDNERYCYQDWQVIVKALMALPNVIFTDPETVGAAFGRTVSGTTPPATPISRYSRDPQPLH